jgi:heme/copper-type cytochrome/quinol oxidase subunit 2
MTERLSRLAIGLGAMAGLLLTAPVQAGGPQRIYITIKDHRFDPAEIHVPAGTPVILVITNADDTSEEFDSADLRIEKVLQGGQKGSVWLRPLTAGTYSFMGEFHADTAKGSVIAE